MTIALWVSVGVALSVLLGTILSLLVSHRNAERARTAEREEAEKLRIATDKAQEQKIKEWMDSVDARDKAATNSTEQQFRQDFINLIDKHQSIMTANQVLMLQNVEFTKTLAHREDTIDQQGKRIDEQGKRITLLEKIVPGLEKTIEERDKTIELRELKITELGKQIDTLVAKIEVLEIENRACRDVNAEAEGARAERKRQERDATSGKPALPKTPTPRTSLSKGESPKTEIILSGAEVSISSAEVSISAS